MYSSFCQLHWEKMIQPQHQSTCTCIVKLILIVECAMVLLKWKLYWNPIIWNPMVLRENLYFYFSRIWFNFKIQLDMKKRFTCMNKFWQVLPLSVNWVRIVNEYHLYSGAIFWFCLLEVYEYFDIYFFYFHILWIGFIIF